MFSLILNSYLKIKNKKKFSKQIKRFKIQNHKGFYVFLNYHTQQRSGYNITRVYLLNEKRWYFQKKQLFKIPVNLKKQEINIITTYETQKTITSKLNDFIKKIF